MVRQSSHLAAVPLEQPDFARAHTKVPPVHLRLPKKHATLLVPKEDGVLEPHVPSMQALQHFTEVEWHSVAAHTRAHTPLAGACEAVPLGAVHHGPTHKDLLRARDGRLSSMQVMRQWQKKVTRTVIPAHPCILFGGLEEDTGHMRMLCARDKAVARLLCAKMEEITADLPRADKTMGFMSWKEHGCRWTESLMTGVVPGDLRQLFAVVRAASSGGLLRRSCSWRTGSRLGKIDTPGGIMGSPRSCNFRCVIGGRGCMHSCGMVPPFGRRLKGLGGCRHGTRESFRWPPRQPAGGLSEGNAVCDVGVQAIPHT